MKSLLLVIAILLLTTPVMAQTFEKVDSRMIRETRTVTNQYDVSELKRAIQTRLSRIAELKAENARDQFIIDEAVKVGVGGTAEVVEETR